jgi:hypothetical protein
MVTSVKAVMAAWGAAAPIRNTSDLSACGRSCCFWPTSQGHVIISQAAKGDLGSSWYVQREGGIP